jgi:hypothetical protein
MRSASLGLIVLGIIVGILGLVNHFVLNPRLNPVPHTSTVVGVVALVLVVIGGAMMFMGGRSAS